MTLCSLPKPFWNKRRVHRSLWGLCFSTRKCISARVNVGAKFATKGLEIKKTGAREKSLTF